MQSEATADLPERFNHLADILEGRYTSPSTDIAPLIFRRETAFRNNLLGNSVPSWGSGLAASESFGPFIDAHGLNIWFDFFHPTRTVKVFIQGQPQPALLIPVWGTLTARNNYRIEAGSVWVASNLIARTSLLNGYYTGLKINSGTLDLAVNATINGESIVIGPFNTGTLQLELKQNTVTNPPAEAGFDATAAIIELPKTFSLQFNAINSTVKAADASCTVFGNDTRFQFKNVPPVWVNFLSYILIPYTASTNSETTDSFQINSSDSRLCHFSKSAKIDTNSGWLLPAAQINASQLGEASGTGSLCTGLQKGLSTTWKGLRGGSTKLVLPE